jgi:hypothetical protein
MEIPQWHKDLVLNRIEKARLNPERMLDWSQTSKILTHPGLRRKSNIIDLKKDLRNIKLRKSKT